MKLEQGMIIDGYVARTVNNDNIRAYGKFYVDTLEANETILRPVKEDGDYWILNGRTIVIGENTNALGDWTYVAFVETVFIPNIAKKPASATGNPLDGMTKEDLLAWIKENLNGPTD